MKVLYYKNGEYFFGENEEDSFLEKEKCILHSSVQSKEVWLNDTLYNGRVSVCRRGDNWYCNDYALIIDRVGITSGFRINYCGEWVFSYSTEEKLISLLNLIESRGPDYVLKEYEVRLRREHQMYVDMTKTIEPHLKDLKSFMGTQTANQLLNQLHECVSKFNLLTERLRVIDEAKSMRK